VHLEEVEVVEEMPDIPTPVEEQVVEFAFIEQLT